MKYELHIVYFQITYFLFLNNRENYFDNENNSIHCNYYTFEKYKELESIYSLFNLSLVNFNFHSFGKNSDSFDAVLSMNKFPDFVVLSWNLEQFYEPGFVELEGSHTYRISLRGGGFLSFA